MKIKDERISQAQTKIHSELFIIAYYIIALSLVVKVLFLKQNLTTNIAEFIILVGTPVYQAVRSRQLGVVLMPMDKKYHHKNALLSLATVVIIFAVVAFLNGGTDSSFAIPFIISYAIVFALTRVVFVKAEARRAEKLQSYYDEDE